ncbi:MAG TPA: proton-conducting transporter membrane subunit, partial [Bacillota bacterium]|nr:proton-conducting transporter membrane subunit [Bacillota bacterium]
MVDWQGLMLGLSLASYLLGAVIALVLKKNSNLSNLAGNCLAALGALLGMGSGLSVLISGRTLTLFLPQIVPFADFSIELDSLAALFVVVISLAVLVVSIYALGYVTEYRNTGKTGYLGCVYNVFVASMVLVVTAGNAYQFLLAWESMSLVSYLLVSFKHEEQETRTAGYIYLIMTHIGTAFITMAFLLLYKATGSFDFAGFRAVGHTLSPALMNLIFVLGLIGFGTKAGLVPVHIWLPRAHPVAPSHVSAL